MRRGVAGVHGRRRRKQLPGGMESGRLKSIDCGNGTQRKVECGWFSRLAGDATLAFAKQQFGIDLRRHLGGKLALQHQYIVHLPIKSTSPDHVTPCMKIE